MAKTNDVALAKDIELDKILALQNRIDNNSVIIDSIVNKLVDNYCRTLDEYMVFIKSLLDDPNQPPTDMELDDFTLNLPVLLYFTGEAQEALGIREDIAKAIKMDLYNDTHAQAKGTVADKASAAEAATQNEFLVHIAYQRAYKKIKNRMESASEMLQSVKKVISRRMAEYEMTQVDAGRIGGNHDRQHR